MPAALTLEEAAVFKGAYHTAYHALLQKGRMKAGDCFLLPASCAKVDFRGDAELVFALPPL